MTPKGGKPTIGGDASGGITSGGITSGGIAAGGDRSEFDGVTFETALERLESIVTRLERGEITLDASLAAFREGSALVRHCLARLEAAEAAVQQLVDGGGEDLLKPFDPTSPGTERDA